MELTSNTDVVTIFSTHVRMYAHMRIRGTEALDEQENDCGVP